MNTLSDEDRTWGSLAHLSALCGMLIPFGSLLAPLIIWRTRGQRAPFVGDQALEALNFNISVALGFIACLADPSRAWQALRGAEGVDAARGLQGWLTALIARGSGLRLSFLIAANAEAAPPLLLNLSGG